MPNASDLERSPLVLTPDAEDLEKATSLVLHCYHQFAAGDSEPAGIKLFDAYARGLASRSKDGSHRVFITRSGSEVTGMIEIRGHDHISLLFVAPEYLRRGLAGALWRQALAECLRARPDLTAIDVNSSRYAVPVYERLGFRATGGFTVRDGIGFVPMRFLIGEEPRR